jgi:hypothetical protein
MNRVRSVDLLFLACNRLAFTRRSFSTLLANTDWSLVHELFVCDDGSLDGTREWLHGELVHCPAPTRWLATHFGSPVQAMSHFFEQATAPIAAKVDNDTMLPPGWLGQSLAVMDHHPELHFLGLEAVVPYHSDPAISRSFQPAAFISGLGLYRRAVFARSRPQAVSRWFGFEDWQAAQGPKLVRGWLSPALPVFLLDRLPFEPWRSLTADYVSRGWQRPWPPYDPACELWEWAAADLATVPIGRPAPNNLSSTPLRIITALRVKNEAAFIQEVLASVLPLSERVLVFDDHSTDETRSICRRFGEHVTVFESPFAGLDESRDKNYLLRKLIELRPDWVLWIDGDEVLERSGADQLRGAAANGTGIAVFSLRVAYLWDRPDQVRVDGLFGRFRRPSFFRLQGQDSARVAFPVTGQGGNFHCGNVPGGLKGAVRDLDVRLKHYGYLEASKRQAKFTFYTSRDPNNATEDGYRHIIGLPGARHAPGPPQFEPWRE